MTSAKKTISIRMGQQPSEIGSCRHTSILKQDEKRHFKVILRFRPTKKVGGGSVLANSGHAIRPTLASAEGRTPKTMVEQPSKKEL